MKITLAYPARPSRQDHGRAHVFRAGASIPNRCPILSLRSLLLALTTTVLTGCVTPFRAPPEVAHIKLDVADSPIVRVEKVWLERENGPLAVRGYVLKRLEANDTTRTHLDVTLYAVDGRVLRSTVEHFEPRQIPRRYRRPDSASYRVPLDPLPAGTVRIEVRAHEGSHS